MSDNTLCGDMAKGTPAAIEGLIAMSLDVQLFKRIGRQLSALDGQGTTGPRLLDDGARLWRRVQKMLAMDLVPITADLCALELACYALQLPFAFDRSNGPQTKIRTRVKDRAVLATQLLPRSFEDTTDALLHRTLALLQQMPDRAPALADACLLADAVNLEDFGVSGLIVQTIQLCRQGDGLAQLMDGAEKRELYGYWDARLKDGFHFESTRRIASSRLENARAATKLLAQELMQEA